MNEPSASPENDQSQVSNLSHVDVELVKAELVRMHQSSAQSIEAEDVELGMSAAVDVKASNAAVRDSIVGLVQAAEATMQDNLVGAVRAETISVNGVAGVVVAGNVEFGNAYAGIVAGCEVRGEKIESIILLSRRVEGNVTTVIDTRGALIAGLVGGLFAGIMLLLGRMLFGRK